MSLHAGRTQSAPVADIERRSSFLPRVAGVAGFVLLTALAARTAVPLPGTVVPLTLQVTAVLLSGFLLGPKLGAFSQTLYLALGLVGLPVFAAGGGFAYLLGPTGGYLLAFPLAAAAAGLTVSRLDGIGGHVLAGIFGLAAIHLGGLAWLAAAVGPEAAVGLGLLPFLAGDLLKVALAVIVALGLRERALRLLG